jgi:hypothetical protein
MDAVGNRVRPQPTQVFQFPLTGTISKDAIPDGSKGAIVTWSAKVTESLTDADIFAQRIDANVNGSWGSPVTVCSSTNFQNIPHLISDGAGGAIIVWEDRRASGTGDIYAQRVDPSGVPLWTANGAPVCTKPGNQLKPAIAPDGNGGAIIVWEDISSFYVRLYAQRINGAGERQWADTGAVVYFYPTGPTLRGIVSDGAGGAFVCWQDRNSHGDYDVYVQRIDAQGSMVWDPFGARVSTSTKAVNPVMVSDGNGSAIVAWEDSLLGSREVNIYAQRINGAGALLWGSSVSVTDAPNEQYYFSMIPRSNNGAVIAWTDARNWPNPTGLDVYAQSLDSAGVPQWQANGAPVSQPPAPSFAVSAQAFPVLVGNSVGGSIAFWEDSRNAGNFADIYAQGLAALGLPVLLTASVTQTGTNFPFVIGTTPLVTANFAALGSVSSMTVEAYINAIPAGLTKALPRYLRLTANGSGFIATLTLSYTDAEVRAAGLKNGDANLRAYRRSGSDWALVGGAVDTAANTVTVGGVTEFSDWAVRDPSDTLVTGVHMNPELPGEIRLQQNYPNPFNPATVISYQLSTVSEVKLMVYDVLGREVRTLVDEVKPAGGYTVSFDAAGVASGVYFYRLIAGQFVGTRKMVLME